MVDPAELTAALVDPDAAPSWFVAGADSFGPDHQASHHAIANVAQMLTAMMYESGFPLQTFLHILYNHVVEIDNATQRAREAEPTIGAVGAWRNDA